MMLETLRLWSNDYDFIIAENKEEAIALAAKFFSSDKESFEEGDWYALREGDHFTYTDLYGRSHKKTVAEWIEERGKGYFASEWY